MLRQRRQELLGKEEEDNYGLGQSKSKSLEREYSQYKKEINHRLIPIDLLLDAKTNILYLQQHQHEGRNNQLLQNEKMFLSQLDQENKATEN